MKNKKLSLNQLKIESFVTSFDLSQLYGGASIEDAGSDSSCPKSGSKQSNCYCDTDACGSGSGSYNETSQCYTNQAN